MVILTRLDQVLSISGLIKIFARSFLFFFTSKNEVVSFNSFLVRIKSFFCLSALPVFLFFLVEDLLSFALSLLFGNSLALSLHLTLQLFLLLVMHQIELRVLKHLI